MPSGKHSGLPESPGTLRSVTATRVRSASTRTMLLLLVLAFASLSFNGAKAAGPSQPLKLQVFHKLPAAKDFTPRGEITYAPGLGGSAPTHSFTDRLSATERDALAQLVADASQEQGQALYRIKVEIPGTDGKPAKQSVTATKLCMLRSAQLKDQFHLNVDEKGYPYHVQYDALSESCEETSTSSAGTALSTHVTVSRPIRGPSPLGDMPATAKPAKVEYDEKGNVKKPEPEKSFIQKYWMYIVPVLVMFLLTPGEPPQQGGGGSSS